MAQLDLMDLLALLQSFIGRDYIDILSDNSIFEVQSVKMCDGNNCDFKVDMRRVVEPKTDTCETLKKRIRSLEAEKDSLKTQYQNLMKIYPISHNDMQMKSLHFIDDFEYLKSSEYNACNVINKLVKVRDARGKMVEQRNTIHPNMENCKKIRQKIKMIEQSPILYITTKYISIYNELSRLLHELENFEVFREKSIQENTNFLDFLVKINANVSTPWLILKNNVCLFNYLFPRPLRNEFENLEDIHNNRLILQNGQFPNNFVLNGIFDSISQKYKLPIVLGRIPENLILADKYSMERFQPCYLRTQYEDIDLPDDHNIVIKTILDNAIHNSTSMNNDSFIIRPELTLCYKTDYYTKIIIPFEVRLKYKKCSLGHITLDKFQSMSQEDIDFIFGRNLFIQYNYRNIMHDNFYINHYLNRLYYLYLQNNNDLFLNEILTLSMYDLRMLLEILLRNLDQSSLNLKSSQIFKQIIRNVRDGNEIIHLAYVLDYLFGNRVVESTNVKFKDTNFTFVSSADNSCYYTSNVYIGCRAGTGKYLHNNEDLLFKASNWNCKYYMADDTIIHTIYKNDLYLKLISESGYLLFISYDDNIYTFVHKEKF